MDNFDLRKYLAEGKLLKEDMSIEDVYNDAQKQVKDIHDIDVPMNVVKQWADNYQFPYSREVDPEDEDQYILVYDFGTEERGDFMEWLKDNNLREGKLLKEEVSPRFIKKYLSMVKPENFKDIEDIESYSDRDKAIFLYLEIVPGIMVSDELARDLKDKPSEEIVQYFKDRNYSYMPYSAMDRIFGSITPTGMEFERGSPEKVHLDAYGHNRKINKILRDKYSDVIDFMKSDRTGGNEIEVHNAIQDRYSDEAKDGRSREVSYEEYASDFADAIRDRMYLKENDIAEGAYERDSVEDIVKRIKPILANHPQLKKQEDPEQYLIDFVTKRKRFINKNEAPIGKDKFARNIGTMPYDKYINLQFNEYIYSTTP